MTPEQRTLARQFAEAVDTICGNHFHIEGTDRDIPFDWFYTPDGMMYVKAEMAKRDIFIGQ